MDLRPRFLFWVDILMFFVGFGLTFVVVFAYADAHEPEGMETETWEDRLERAEPQVRDTSLTAAVNTALDLTPELIGYALEATTDAGIVYVSGAVPDQHKRDLALEAARDTPGVRAVVNRLEIDPQAEKMERSADQPRASSRP